MPTRSLSSTRRASQGTRRRFAPGFCSSQSYLYRRSLNAMFHQRRIVAMPGQEQGGEDGDDQDDQRADEAGRWRSRDCRRRRGRSFGRSFGTSCPAGTGWGRSTGTANTHATVTQKSSATASGPGEALHAAVELERDGDDEAVDADHQRAAGGSTGRLSFRNWKKSAKPGLPVVRDFRAHPADRARVDGEDGDARRRR